MLDVGTGSGAIALAVADELPGCEVTATDTSPAALEVARANAERLGLAERVRFLEGTLPGGRGFDLVLANLPYVAERDWPALQPEVTKWEPREALLAGPDGLDAYRAFIPGARRAFVPLCGTKRRQRSPSRWGRGRREAVAELMREAGFGEVETRRDLAGIERVVVGRVRGAA